MQTIYISIIMVVITAFMSCQHKSSNLQLKDGDILFRGNNELGLSKAINEVTQTGSKTNYTHMGICQINNDTVWIIHASPEHGVNKELLQTFSYPHKDINYIVDVYRLNQKHTNSIVNALGNANKLIGKHYDPSYLIDNEGYYCSEFIYEIFKKDSIFKLNPMTFINPQTKKYHDDWIEHYNNLGIPIPEGEMGCNPNEMATSNKLFFVTRL